MGMKKFGLNFVVLAIVFLAGCANAFESEGEEPVFLEVDLSVQPQEAEPGDPIVFEAKVTYGEENVTDADDVKFEIWRAHAEDHDVIRVEHAENGIYRLKESFQEEGTYYVISHVTGRNMHNMPKEEFIIGEASEPEEGYNSKVMSIEDFDFEDVEDVTDQYHDEKEQK